MNSTRQLVGPVRQVAYIVDDVEAAALGWVKRFGIGPWRIKHGLRLDQCSYGGKLIDLDLSMASSYSNGLEVELIAQPEGPASMYSDFLQRNGPGAHHLCFFPADYAAAEAHLLATGMHVTLEGAIRGTRFAYFDDGLGQVIELADVSADGLAVRAERAAMADTWDGTEPLRV